jgi:hypothetical protein
VTQLPSTALRDSPRVNQLPSGRFSKDRLELNCIEFAAYCYYNSINV